MIRRPAFGLVGALLLFGCGKESTPSGPSASSAGPGLDYAASRSTPISSSELDKVGKAGKPYRLALIVKTRNNPFFEPMIRAFEAEARAMGCVPEVHAPPQETDKEHQFDLVTTVTAGNVDAILIAPADSRAIIPALKRADEKGVLVVNLDNRVDRGAVVSVGAELGGYVGADNQRGGELAGEKMVELLGGKGKVAILEGIRGADNAEARRRGFEEAVRGKLDVVAKDSAEWDTQKAYAKFQSMLAANKELDGLFCANDKMALGAAKAIREAGRSGQITLIGYDNIADVEPLLRSGELAATIEQHPDLMGKYGVRMAVGILDGSVPRGREHLVSLEVIAAHHRRPLH